MLLRSIILMLLVYNLLPQTVLAVSDLAPRQWSYERVRVYEAWDLAHGSRDVVVAVIDNGFDMDHPDLADNVWKNSLEIPNNKKDDDQNGYIDDVYGWDFAGSDTNGDGEVSEIEAVGDNDPSPDLPFGSDADKDAVHHATIIAGIIGAAGDNGRDGAGINWQVRLMNVRAIGANGEGSIPPLARGIRYAVDNGADVINISMVGEPTEIVREAVEYAYARGVVVVAAAGNTLTDLDKDPLFPICVDAASDSVRVLGVSAIRNDRRTSGFSNGGATCIDVSAPGVDISSTNVIDPSNGLNNSYTEHWHGTSFATPFVAGTAALVKSVRPDWTASQIYEAILSSVSKTPGQDEAVYSYLFGKGLLQVDGAVRYAENARPFLRDAYGVTEVDMQRKKATVHEGGKETALSGNFSARPLLVSEIPLRGRVRWQSVEPRGGKNMLIEYDDMFRELRRTRLPYQNPSAIIAGDFSSDAGLETVILPAATSTKAVVIVNEKGKRVASFDKNFSRRGRLAAAYRAPGAAFDRLAILTKVKGDWYAYHMSENVFFQGEVVRLDVSGTPLAFAVFDIDNARPGLEMLVVSNRMLHAFDASGQIIFSSSIDRRLGVPTGIAVGSVANNSHITVFGKDGSVLGLQFSFSGEFVGTVPLRAKGGFALPWVK